MSEPRVYTPRDAMALLRIKRSVYYKLTAADARGKRLLEYSRLYPGGPRVHTQEQIDAYLEYLNGAGSIAQVAKRQMALAS